MLILRAARSEAWAASSDYKLGSQSPQDNSTWGLGRVDVPTSVPYGSEATFSFTVVAPREAGTYTFQWRMLEEHVAWFGEFTPAATVTVSSGGGAASLEWLVTDQLGTPRMVLDESGGLSGVSRHDYFPFGEEIGAGVGGRTTAQGYSQFDGVRQRYTGAERDDETGLDFMQARYYSSTQGRFTSVDPLTVTAERIVDPQQLNLYAYVRNNPLAFIDPTGMIIDPSRLNEKDKGRWEKIQEIINAKDKDGNYLHLELKASYDKLQADERTFYLQGGKLGGGDAGKFEIETFKGDNDFSAARITLDFGKIKDANVSEALFGGFKQFEGLRTNEERFTEVTGHEFKHATDAIDNPAEAVRIQKLINETTPAILAANKARMPISPDVKMKIEEKNRLLEKGEQSAYGAERRILQELRASQKQRK